MRASIPHQPAVAGGRLSWPAAAAASLLLLAACSPAGTSGPSTAVSASASLPAPAATTDAPSAGPSSPAPAPAALLLEVRNEGGFINPAATIGALPTVVVDTDGRIFTPAPAADGGPLLIPAVNVRDTGPAGAAAILAAATAAGLADGSAGGGVAADTGVTVFTLEAGGSEVVTRVAAGGPVGGPIGGPVGGPGVQPGASGDATRTPGIPALDLLARLTDPTVAWGGTVAAPATYDATAYRVWLAKAADGAAGATERWPLAGDPAAFGAPAAADLGVDGLRSGILSGADAATLAQALARAAAGTELTASGSAYQVWVEPLLPDEVGG